MEHKESKSSMIANYYSLHYEELKAFVASRMPSTCEAEDLVQNVFVRLLQNDKMIIPVTLPSLVYTMTKNLITDYWRRKQRIEEYEHTISKQDWPRRYAEDVESIYSARQINEILEKGIARLSDKQRPVYLMNLYDGMPVSEIATQLDMNYKCIENRLGSARKIVRKYMERMLA